MMGHTKIFAGVAVAALLTFAPAHASSDYAEEQYISTKAEDALVGKVKTHRRGAYGAAKQVSSSEEWRDLDLAALAQEAEIAADAAASCTDFIERHQVFGRDCMRAMDLGASVYDGLMVINTIRVGDDELMAHFGYRTLIDAIVAFDEFGVEYLKMANAIDRNFK